jgi:hypothetical protein
MSKCNKQGVPMWAIRRLLICRVNLLSNGYKTFHITKSGRVFFDSKYVTHIDCIYYDKEINGYCMPIAG